MTNQSEHPPSKERIPARDFHFQGMEKDQLVKKVNQRYPVVIHSLDTLVERVHSKYPLIEKDQIEAIIKVSVMSLRELLLRGAVINFFSFISDLRLLVSLHRRFGQTYPAVKFRGSTSKKIQKDTNGT